ncbi:probable G-protein coupled receptor 156 isoform X3 [Ailuropoda melanoleuca]|uniref:probable G-protein coupled receptor 156 isoform X3 n=1 Tax=Ailuropoda melanoleuca TaxID=9646 RepID=UPI0014940F9E|nr:probable G-protein coupled receptor 156 isoform X3 [Ailuropoda melanoleuca]
MEPEINCSELCDGIPGQELDRSPLHDLCRTITSSHYSSKTISSLSPVLLGVVWTFLSCGLLLIVFFLGFTIRCRNNRIVKMSSPNLNIVTLLGSCLTYSSVYLFGIQDRDALVEGSMETLIQIRLSMLCIGTSLVFGPILGKSWRLYKVFTQRVPDKRVGLLLLYGAYLAGLTDHVSSPPVNQSLTIMVGVNLVVVAAGLLFVVTRYLHSWPNLVFGLTSGGIFVCTTTINCFIFIPQLKQWKAFEEENQTTRRMAKYFSTPSKSFHTPYGEEQNCHTGGERNSMDRLLTEKNAMIESLQEQVNNAKEKLVRLMSAECTFAPSEWAVPPSSSHSKNILVAASAHNLVAQGPSECLSDSQNGTSVAAPVGSQSTSVPSSSIQSLERAVKDTSSSPGQKEKISSLKDVSEHLNLGCSQKPWPNQSRGAERRDQVPMNPHQSLIPGGEGPVPQRQGQLENSEEPQKRLSRVNSVIREKLQEVLQDLGLGTEAPFPSSLSYPQQPWKSNSTHSPQMIPLSKELGFSPYMVRRRRAALRARSHFPGSIPSYVGHRANKTGAHSGRLNVHNRDSACLDPQTADSRVPKPSSRKTSLLPDPQGKLGTMEGSKQSQTEPQGATGSHAAFPHQPSGSDWASCPTAPHLSRASPDVPEQQLLLPLGFPHCPSVSSPCNYLDTESSSSDEFFCRCHRPYCEICFQSSSDSSDSGSSDSDPDPAGGLASWEKLWARSKPIVNFKDDLKPTLV